MILVSPVTIRSHNTNFWENLENRIKQYTASQISNEKKMCTSEEYTNVI